MNTPKMRQRKSGKPCMPAGCRSNGIIGDRGNSMFTGIVTDIGELRAVEQRGDLKARIATRYDTGGIEIGASIACDGVCLTVTALGPDWFEVDISAETVSKTSIGAN